MPLSLWAWADLNSRPHAYQACALTKLSYRPFPSNFHLDSLKTESFNFNLSNSLSFFSRKEVIQPHLPVRLPCYDLAPVTEFAFDGIATGFGHPRLPWLDGRCVQGPGTYSPQHDDLRLLAIPTSCSRVADYNPN